MSAKLFVILNKETNEIFTTPNGKWHWSTKNAAGAAYTLHMRSGTSNDSIPRLRDDACPYFAMEIQFGYDKEERSKTRSIRKEIQS